MGSLWGSVWEWILEPAMGAWVWIFFVFSGVGDCSHAPFSWQIDTCNVLLFRWHCLSLQISLLFRGIWCQDLRFLYIYIYIYIYIDMYMEIYIDKQTSWTREASHEGMLREVSHEGNFKQHLWRCCICMSRPSETQWEQKTLRAAFRDILWQDLSFVYIYI